MTALSTNFSFDNVHMCLPT